MQSLTEIATRIEPERKSSQTTLAERLNISDWEERRAVLAEIFYLDRAASQYEGRDPEDLDALVQTVIPLTRSIPVNYLPECYVVALEMRKPEDNFQIRGVELLNAWKVVQGRLEMESKGAFTKTKQLTANARHACSRCFGTGMERMPDGSVRPGCLHDQWTPEDEEQYVVSEQERRENVRRQAELMREALRSVGRPKPEPRADRGVPAGRWLKCSSCPRKPVNVLHYEPGRRCNDLLNRGTHEGELKLCDGTLQSA